MDLATVMRGLAMDHVKKGRLSRAVRSDDADSVSRANHDRCAGKEHSVTNSLFELSKAQ